MNWSRRVYILIMTATTAPIPLLLLMGGAGPRALWFVLPAAALGWLAARAVTAPMAEAQSIARRLHRGEWQARPAGRLPEPWGEVVGKMAALADALSRVTRDMERQVGERTAQLERKAGQLRALGQVGHQVAAVREPGALLHYVVRLMRGTFGYDFVAIVQNYGDHFIAAACAMRGEAEPPTGRVFAADDAAVAPILEALQRDRPLVKSVGGAESDPRRAPIPIVDGWRPEAELIVPIRHGRRTLGAMVVQSASPRAFDDDDVFTVDTIAGQVAVALENARLFESERQLRRLAITEERNRIAREIHDTLAQGFMGILIHLRAMRGADDADTAARHRSAAESLAQESLQEARRSVWNLRPARLHDRGLLGALEDELERLRSQSELRTEFAVSGDGDVVESLSSDGAAALLRIGQEALHNVIKHARARSVRVLLHADGAGVQLIVSDDGVGFVPGRPARFASTRVGDGNRSAFEDGGNRSAFDDGVNQTAFGLIGMRERIEAVGGTFAVETEPGAGTTVRARVPVAAKQEVDP